MAKPQPIFGTPESDTIGTNPPYSFRKATAAQGETIHGGDGNDTIYGLGGNDLLYGDNGDDQLYGGDGADSIFGGTGNDMLLGEAGDDTLDGGGGNDSINGGAGTDTATYRGAWVDYRITVVGGMTSLIDNRGGSPDGTDTVTDVEMFRFANGTFTAAEIVNDAPAAVADSAIALEAGGVNNGTPGVNPVGNVLTNDTDPDSTLGDTKTVQGVAAGALAGPLGSGVGVTVLGAYGRLVLQADGAYVYTLDNSNPAVEALNPGDQLADVFTYTMKDAAGQTSTTTLTVTIGGATDTLGATIIGDDGANLLFGTAGDDIILGLGGDDRLLGYAGNDTLYGGMGADRLFGGDGDDTMLGEAGADMLSGGPGKDFIDGGDGFDFVSFGSPVVVDLGAATATGEGDDTLVDIEGVVGSSGNDSITGDDSPNSLYGGEGDDTIAGAGGNDRISGDQYPVFEYIGNGSGPSYIGGGSDEISGGDGNDVISGDQFTADVFEISSWAFAVVQGGSDQISGGDGNDVIYGDQLTANAFSYYGGTIIGGNDTIAGGGGDDIIYGDGASASTPYSYGAGSVSGGDDVITGGAGADLIYGDWGFVETDVFIGGHDTFVYLSTGDGGDTIGDFRPGEDLIDVSAIDANTNLGGDQAFGFAGTVATNYSIWFSDNGTDTTLYFDNNGDASADMNLVLLGVNGTDLSLADFVA